MDRTAVDRLASQSANIPMTVAAKAVSPVEVSPLQHGWLTAMGIDAPWIVVRPDLGSVQPVKGQTTASANAAVSESTTTVDSQSAHLPELALRGSTGKAPSQEIGIPSSNVGGLSLAELNQSVSTCKKCMLCETRQHAVAGDGVSTPTILIVGEAPGEQEDVQGKPFVGRSGQLLDNMLRAIGHDRQTTTYITNVVKCRPPANRNPRDEEIAACAGYLERQLELLKPSAILAMGRFAAHALLKTNQPLQALRQTEHVRHVGVSAIPVVVTYHPAYLLRRPADKRLAWDDLKRLHTLVTKHA